MATQTEPPRGVHLNGSVRLENTTAVLTLVSTILGKHLRRMPDGETRARTNWIAWQIPLLTSLPDFENTKSRSGAYRHRGPLCPPAGVTAEQIRLPAPGYSAAFAPLKGLKLRPEIELYLGLVHYTDGVEGAQGRIKAAQSVVTDFGVATECGMGRRSPATIPDLLSLHARVAAPIR